MATTCISVNDKNTTENNNAARDSRHNYVHIAHINTTGYKHDRLSSWLKKINNSCSATKLHSKVNKHGTQASPSKKTGTLLYFLTSQAFTANIDQCLNLLHCLNQENTCN